MWGTADIGSRSSSSVGISVATPAACIAPAMAHTIHPTSTNSTEPTEIQGSRAGELGQLVHPTTTVDGMVMTQEATIFTTTRRLTPWLEATPEPVIEDAAAWVVEMGMPMPVAPEDRGHRADVGHQCGTGTQRRDAQAHRLDDLPATPHRADREGAVGDQRNPPVDLKIAVRLQG
jgi:hypothetical protein